MAGLFKVVLTCTPGGDISNPFVNVFGFRSNLVVLNEEKELNDAFEAQLLPDVASICQNLTFFRRIEVYNVSNGTGYYDKNLSPIVVGARSGDNLPGFVAWGFQYNRTTAGKRNGFKRFGLVSESDTTGDGPTAGMAVVLAALATNLATPLKIGLIDTWFPEILERKPTGVYPWTSHPILNVVYKRMTTQNSRKR